MPRRFFHAKKEVMEVPNEENLIPVRSESEAREKGGRGKGERGSETEEERAAGDDGGIAAGGSV